MFSLNWFKSKKEKQLDELRHQIRIKDLEKQLEKMDNPPEPSNTGYTSVHGGWNIVTTTTPQKPYKSVKMVNDVLTVVLNDGSVLSKTGATKDDFEDVRNALDEAEVLDVIEDEGIVAERKRAEAEAVRISALKRGIELLKSVDDLRVDGNSVYFKGIDRSMPQLMVEQLITLRHKDPYMTQSDEYLSLKRFFMWCCLNPRAEVADKLYNFLMKNSFKITKQGFFAALRNVVTLHGGTELIDFVSNAYNKVKAVWKKSPDDYTVFLQDGQYKLVHYSDLYETIEQYDDETDESYEDEIAVNHGEKVGGLTELYLDLPNRIENRYTDAHTRTFDIRVGRVVNMDPARCSWNTDDCGAAGLHFTSDEIHYVGCGDQSVLVLINPMKVVGIGESKGRCWEYLPIMTVPREEATSLLHDLDFDTLQLDDAYAVKELEGLAERAKEGFVTEAKKHAFNIPAISHVEIENIVESLQEMKDILSKRVTIIE